jgi:hypothetical protein
MSELVTPTSDPAYVTKLALRSIPFNDQIDSSLFMPVVKQAIA